MSTPTARTLALLRKEGKICEVVEKWNSFTMQRKDVFGFIDILSIDVQNKITWGIQATSTGNVQARVKKICMECKEKAMAWLQAGNHIEVIGWAKRGAKGKQKRWQAKRIEVTIEDFAKFDKIEE